MFAAQIESAARVVWKQLGWSELPCGDLLRALEHPHCAAVLGLEVFVLMDEELPHAEAEYLDTIRQLHVRNSVATLAYNGDGRARWTLCHELAHGVLHKGQLKYPAQRPSLIIRKTHILEASFSSEWQADQFAKVFLMPTHLCVGIMTPREIQQKCGVSEQAAKIRFSELASLREKLKH
jgi:IrrE N-terminal-like domain